VLLTLLATGSSTAQPTESGDAALASEDYEGAAALYREVLQARPNSSDTHFNLGLALVHLNQLSLATYHMFQAQYLAPFDGEIRQSLALVRAEQRRRLAEAGSVGETVAKGEPDSLFWLDLFHRVSRGATEVVLIALAWLTFGLLFLRRRMRRTGWRDVVTVVSVLSSLVLLHAVAYRVGAVVTRNRIRPAVVVAERPMVWEAPDRLAARRTDEGLFDGAVVLVGEQRDDWVEVELVTGDTGWLPKTQLRPIQVPE
jgi:tetratricopeptide (TPR) repeat protein